MFFSGIAQSFFFNLYIYFLYLFLAVLGLRFCVRAFSSCGKWGPLFIAVCGPLTITASLVAEHRLQMRRLSLFFIGEEMEGTERLSNLPYDTQ